MGVPKETILDSYIIIMGGVIGNKTVLIYPHYVDN